MIYCMTCTTKLWFMLKYEMAGKEIIVQRNEMKWLAVHGGKLCEARKKKGKKERQEGRKVGGRVGANNERKGRKKWYFGLLAILSRGTKANLIWPISTPHKNCYYCPLDFRRRKTSHYFTKNCWSIKLIPSSFILFLTKYTSPFFGTRIWAQYENIKRQ